ncbi:hypothetical protein PHLGIDRAFT_125902 [Phlebiopsis gigantea 11061_1 CR5-6]|uniref:Uncharacterized protein n=1 Tax=Phlebiopsis gigantea (strain 11061_1 CR5-6) TaxID=745531 RepID=A0A0C3NWW4_PHLG1|nr:hypothetical protein PHLGIDRAFT_125902 [Phlebiopsis gigantea 11061_1 CR5-6]
MVCTALSIDMMDSPEAFNYSPSGPQPATVKVEPNSLDLGHSLLHSPPSSRSSSRARYSTITSSTRYKRKASNSSIRSELSIMTHPYGNWSSAALKNEQSPGHRGYSGGSHPSGSTRRGGSGDQQFFNPDSYSQPHEQYRGDGARHLPGGPQNSSSSLSGAMGDLAMSHSPSTASPSGMAWTPSPTSGLPGSYIVTQPEGSLVPYLATPNTPLHSDSPPHTFLSYQQYNHSYSASGSSPTHVPGLPSPPAYPDQFTYSQTRPGVMHPPTILPQPLSASPTGLAMSVSPPPTTTPNIALSRSRGSQERLDDEVRALRFRVRELEQKYHSAHDKARELEAELARVTYGASGLPTPAASPAVSTSFNDGWKKRTEARIKLFCSLNRAGNALCAWHDSRRERRTHPPRMAPPGHLNCGCTYDEALFEESLAHHGVGSYHPGENVRMDPMLRNPLLKLLQERYGYRDGDFERDPLTGEWLDGDGPQRWEAKAAGGGPVSKKMRLDDRR